MSRKSKNRRRFACWACGKPMRRKATVCGKCRKTRPAAAKAQVAAVSKAYGAKVRPVPVPAAGKPARPRCPGCGAKAGRKAASCRKCGTVLPAAAARRAEKAAQSRGTPEWFERQAAGSCDPAEREALRAEGARVRQASGAAGLVMKMSGARSLREAAARESDPHVREMLRSILREEGRNP